MSTALSPFEYVVANLAYGGILAILVGIEVLALRIHARIYSGLDLQARMSAPVFSLAAGLWPLGVTWGVAAVWLIGIGVMFTDGSWVMMPTVLAWLVITIGVLGHVGTRVAERLGMLNDVGVFDIRSASEPTTHNNLEARVRWTTWGNFTASVATILVLTPLVVFVLPDEARGPLILVLAGMCVVAVVSGVRLRRMFRREVQM